MQRILTLVLSLICLQSWAVTPPILHSNGLLVYRGSPVSEIVNLSLSPDGMQVEMEVLVNGSIAYTGSFLANEVKQFRFVNMQRHQRHHMPNMPMHPQDSMHMDMMSGLMLPMEMIHHDPRPGNVREMEGMLNLVKYIDVTHKTVSSGNWENPATWTNGIVPKTGARVLIQKQHEVQISSKIQDVYRSIRIDGILKFKEDTHTTLRVNTMVVDMGGTFIVGTESSPITASANIQFAKLIEFETLDENHTDYDPHRLGLGMISHGAASIYGSPKTGYATISGANSGTVNLKFDFLPRDWKVGDEIVIAGTSYNGEGDEKRFIASIDYNSNSLTLDAALEKNHQPIAHTKEGLELKIHVINLTRNIVFETPNLMSQRTMTKGLDLEGRGHIMFMHTNNAKVHYAAFNFMGRTDKQNPMRSIVYDSLGVYQLPAQNPLARYPIHFHRAGEDTSPAEVYGCAVHNSPGWGYVNHSSNVHIKNNVSYDIMGAGFVSEAGDEKGSFINNVAIRSLGNGEENTSAEEQFAPNRAQTNQNNFGSAGDGFWYHSSEILIEGNIASGFTGGGHSFWDEGIDGVNEMDSLNREPINFQNCIAYGGNIGLNISSIKRPEHGDNTFKNIIAWNINIGMFRKYVRQSNFIDFTFINNINRPHGAATFTKSNGKENMLFNPHFEGFVKGVDFEHRERMTGVLGGYLNNVYNIEINHRHERRQVKYFKDVEFGTLSELALSRVDSEEYAPNFDGKQYNYYGFQDYAGASDSDAIFDTITTKFGQLSDFYIYEGNSVYKAYLKNEQHPDTIPWAGDPFGDTSWLNLTNYQLENSDIDTVRMGQFCLEYYDTNEVFTPDSSYYNIVLKELDAGDLPFAEVIIKEVPDIVMPKGAVETIDLSKVFFVPNPYQYRFGLKPGTGTGNKVSLNFTDNELAITAINTGTIILQVRAKTTDHSRKFIAKIKVTVLEERPYSLVENDYAEIPYQTAWSVPVLDNDLPNLSITGFGQEATGTVTMDSNNQLKYQPSSNFSTIDSFAYYVVNASGFADTAKAYITMKPLVYDLYLDVLEGEKLHFDLSNNIDQVSAATFGEASVNDSILIYEQNEPNHNGNDQFTYTIAGQTATVYLTIIPKNRIYNSEEVIFGDGFEDEEYTNANWSKNATNGMVDILGVGSMPYSGRKQARVKKKAKMWKRVSTTGFEDIKISFARKTSDGFDTHNGVATFEWKAIGSPWQTLMEDSDASDYELFKFNLPNAAAANKGKLIFRLDQNSNKLAEYTYLDIVKITGVQIDPTDLRAPEVEVENMINNSILFCPQTSNEIHFVSIKNTGNKQLSISNFNFDLDPVFELQEMNEVPVLYPGASFVIPIKINLDNTLQGTNGSISFETNDDDEELVSINLGLCATYTVPSSNNLIINPNINVNTALAAKQIELSIFPNPVAEKGNLFATLILPKKSESVQTILLVNGIGQIVQKLQFAGVKGKNTFKIPTGNIERGIYYLKVKGSKVVQKIIVE